MEPPEGDWHGAADTEGEPVIRVAARLLEPGPHVAAGPALDVSPLRYRTVGPRGQFLGVSPKSAQIPSLYPRAQTCLWKTVSVATPSFYFLFLFLML